MLTHTLPRFSPRLLLAFVLSLCACLSAHASLPIEHWTHPSGAQVYLVSSPYIPMLDVRIDFDGGSRRDPASQMGLAHATANMLSAGVAAQSGQGALDENQLSQAWVDLGASLAAQASKDRLSISLRSLSDPALLDRAVRLAARQLAAPAWPDRVWQRERQSALAHLKEADTQAPTHAERLFARAVYGSHPYGFEPVAATLGAITTAHMRTFFRRHAVACRAHVTLVGAVDRAQAERIATRLMDALQPHGCPSLPSIAPVQPLAQAVEKNLPFEAAQAQIRLGQPGVPRHDPDFFPLVVGNYILGGGGFVSRLTQEVREKRGLSYSVYSDFSPELQASAFDISLSTRPDQAALALGVARDVVRQFVEQGPTEAEVQAAKDFLINGFALRIESNRKLLDNVANIAWYGLPLDYLDTWSDHVQRVSAADIHRAFKRMVNPQRMVSVVVGARP